MDQLSVSMDVLSSSYTKHLEMTTSRLRRLLMITANMGKADETEVFRFCFCLFSSINEYIFRVFSVVPGHVLTFPFCRYRRP